MGLRRDLEAAPIPLRDVIVADDALVDQAADAIQLDRSGTPGLFRLAWRASEAPVVVGKKTAQDLVGRFDIGGSGQTEFAGEAVLQGAPEACDTAFGLRTLRGDVGDAELIQGAAELGGLAAAGQLLFQRPVISRTRWGRRRWLGRPRLACARAASPPCRNRDLSRLTCRGVRSSSAAALAHARSPFTHDEITATRCNSFWLKRKVSLFIG